MPSAQKAKGKLDDTQRRLLTGIVLCAAFMAIELVAGYVSGSLAILTDAAHMLSDLSSFGVSLGAIWVASLPGTLKMSFGYHRAEILAALFSILVIWAMTLWLLAEAVNRILLPSPVRPKIMIYTAIFGIGTNLVLATVLSSHHHHGHGHGHHHHGHGHGHHHHGHGHHHHHDDHDHQHQHEHCHEGVAQKLALSHHHQHDPQSALHEPLLDGKIGDSEAFAIRKVATVDGISRFPCPKDSQNERGAAPQPAASLSSSSPSDSMHSLAHMQRAQTAADSGAVEADSDLPLGRDESANSSEISIVTPPAGHAAETYRATANLLKDLKTLSTESVMRRASRCQGRRDSETHATNVYVNIGSADGPQILAEALETAARDQKAELAEPKAEPKAEASINLSAAYIHALGDLLQNVGVLVAGLVILYRPEWTIADPICTLIFSIVVFATTIGILRDATNVLMEGTPLGVEPQLICDDLLAIDHVTHVHDVHAWSLSLGRPALSCHLVTDDEDNAKRVLERATSLIQRKHRILHTTIQIDFSTNNSACSTDAHHKCHGPDE